MPSSEPTRLTDQLWLAAHDSVNGKPWIGDWPLGVGLATGLLAELVHDGWLELRQGELFRTTAEPPDDPALRPLLIKMEDEEQNWEPILQPPPARARAPVAAREGWNWPPPTPDGRNWPAHAQDGRNWPAHAQDGRDWPAHAQDGRDWPEQAQDGRSWRPPPVENRHRKRGHELGTWMSYLAYEGRAEARVIDRLSRTGLIRREERRRLLGGTTVRYVPFDSVTSGLPANKISSSVQSRRGLDWSQLLLTGLFLATGLHHHALATLSPFERSQLADQLGQGLDEMSRELLRAADAAVGEAAMR